jgi:hypothetical protein
MWGQWVLSARGHELDCCQSGCNELLFVSRCRVLTAFGSWTAQRERAGLQIRNPCIFVQSLKVEKLSRYHHEGDKRDRRCSSYSFLTSAVDGSEWSASRPGRVLPPEKGSRYSLDRRLGGTSQLVWTQRLEGVPFKMQPNNSHILRYWNEIKQDNRRVIHSPILPLDSGVKATILLVPSSH